MTSRGQCPRGGGACECLHPPPFRKSCLRAWVGGGAMSCAAPGPALALDATGYRVQYECMHRYNMNRYESLRRIHERCVLRLFRVYFYRVSKKNNITLLYECNKLILQELEYVFLLSFHTFSIHRPYSGNVHSSIGLACKGGSYGIWFGSFINSTYKRQPEDMIDANRTKS